MNLKIFLNLFEFCITIINHFLKNLQFSHFKIKFKSKKKVEILKSVMIDFKSISLKIYVYLQVPYRIIIY